MFLFYFFKRLSQLFYNFIFSYYSGGLRYFFNLYQELVYKIEKKLGFFVHLRYLTTPLWSIYSFASYLISIPFRILKILISGFILVLISALFCFFCLIWIILPFYLILKTFF